jgi:uncharacterized phiE125 gp8 family phage protein
VIAFTVKTPATHETVRLIDMKAHLRVSHNAEDGLIAGYLIAAREWVEAYTGRSLATQTWQASLPAFASQVWLPRAAPLQSVTFVKYYDADNVLQAVNAANYLVPAFHEPAVIEKLDTASWPSVYLRSDAVQVEYIAGYADGACPQALAQAVQVLAAHFYEHREASLAAGDSGKEAAFAVTALCSPYRVWLRDPERMWPWR